MIFVPFSGAKARGSHSIILIKTPRVAKGEYVNLLPFIHLISMDDIRK
jgi:hypothetical protein